MTKVLHIYIATKEVKFQKLVSHTGVAKQLKNTGMVVLQEQLQLSIAAKSFKAN